MAQVLFSIGSIIFGVLGLLHLLYTFFTDKFEPFDATVGAAMKQTSPKLTKETTMWNAWIGFNASHSYGAILMTAVYLPLALFHFELIQTSLWFLLLPIAVGIAYLILAKQYWFKIPFIGLLLATLCFILGATLVLF